MKNFSEGQRSQKSRFLQKLTQLQKYAKNNWEVAAEFPERFWKDYGPYFPKIKIASTKLWFFIPFGNQNGIILLFPEAKESYRFGSQKAWKIMILLMQFLFSKNMDPNLSKTVPGIPLRPLNHFLRISEVGSILVKIVILAIFDLQKIFSSNSKNRSRGRSDIPGTVLKSSGSILSIPQLRFEIWAFLQPER